MNVADVVDVIITITECSNCSSHWEISSICTWPQMPLYCAQVAKMYLGIKGKITWCLTLVSLSRSGHSVLAHCPPGSSPVHICVCDVCGIQHEREGVHSSGVDAQSHSTGLSALKYWSELKECLFPSLLFLLHASAVSPVKIWVKSAHKKILVKCSPLVMVNVFLQVNREETLLLSDSPSGSYRFHSFRHGQNKGWQGAAEVRHGCADSGCAVNPPHSSCGSSYYRALWTSSVTETEELSLWWASQTQFISFFLR